MADVGGKLQWKGAAEQQHRFLHLCVGGEETDPCMFNVILNKCKEYEILDGLHQRCVVGSWSGGLVALGEALLNHDDIVWHWQMLFLPFEVMHDVGLGTV